MKQQFGFTLLELLIALALGSIVMASAVLLFVSGQQNLQLQNSAGSIQDDQNFGMAYIASGIRLANLNNPTATVNPEVDHAGIVFSAGNFPSNVTLESNFATDFVSKATSRESNFTNAGGPILQDQLVIQYRPSEVGGFDCTGTAITTRNEYVIERYFVRTDNQSAVHESTDELKSVLACAAGRYAVGDTATSISSSFYDENGQVVLKRIELFKVRFQVQNADGNRAYMMLEDYVGLTDDHPRVIAVQLAAITRGANPIPDASLTLPSNFSIWTNYDVTLADDQGRYLRTPLVQTIALRNAVGAR